MAILNPSGLRNRGAAAVERCRGECLRLVLIYCGVTALLNLGSNGLHLYLDSHIVGTGGLSGLGMRSVLQTVQELLVYINFFFTPFWTAGFLYAMMNLVRGQAPGSADLLAGFRRFGRVLAHTAFHVMILMVLVMAAANAAAVIFSFTPLSGDFVEQMGPLMNDPAVFTPEGILDLSKVPMETILAAMWPMLAITAAILLPVYIWLSYGFRLSLYLVMDQPISGARAYMESMRLMRGHKRELFRLDLHFWWYHALGLLIALVGYLDTILTTLGISLPMDSTVMFFLTLGGYFVLQTGLFLWKKCEVDSTYVLAYEAIIRSDPAQHG